MFGFLKDEKTDELHRLATQLHDKKDYNSSVDTLKQVKERMLVSNVAYGIESWIRLPKNLQKAGLFDEAIKEFSFLISDIDRRLLQHSSYLGKRDHNRLKNYDLSIIYTAMALVYKWQGIADKKLEYEKLSKDYNQKFLRSMRIKK